MTWRKSSFSGNSGVDCVEVGQWRKSSFSGNNGVGCVETGTARGVVYVRDTKQHGAGPVLAFPAGTWASFAATIKA